MYFLPIFFEFFENKRSFACLRLPEGRREGFGATQTVVYCVYLRARYGAYRLKTAGKTRMKSGFLRFLTAVNFLFLGGSPPICFRTFFYSVQESSRYRMIQ